MPSVGPVAAVHRWAGDHTRHDTIPNPTRGTRIRPPSGSPGVLSRCISRIRSSRFTHKLSSIGSATPRAARLRNPEVCPNDLQPGGQTPHHRLSVPAQPHPSTSIADPLPNAAPWQRSAPPATLSGSATPSCAGAWTATTGTQSPRILRITALTPPQSSPGLGFRENDGRLQGEADQAAVIRPAAPVPSR